VIDGAAATAASLDWHKAARSFAKRFSTEYHSGEEAVAIGLLVEPHPAAEFFWLEDLGAA